MDAAAPKKPLNCIVVTPEKAVLEETCDFVALPLFDGELGVLPGRRPMIGRLGCGELRTVLGTRVHRYYVDGGFVQVRDNTITVLTSKALKAEDINATACEDRLKKPADPAKGPSTYGPSAHVLGTGGALSRFGDMSITYGALSGVMVAMLFFYAVGFALVLGAELNAALAKPDAAS